MDELVTVNLGDEQNTEQGDHLALADCYEPPSLIPLGTFGEATLGKGDLYSDDGKRMFQ